MRDRAQLSPLSPHVQAKRRATRDTMNFRGTMLAASVSHPTDVLGQMNIVRPALGVRRRARHLGLGARELASPRADARQPHSRMTPGRVQRHCTP